MGKDFTNTKNDLIKKMSELSKDIDDRIDETSDAI